MTDKPTMLHGPTCGCTRCRGWQPGNELAFQPGNAAAATHGAYAVVQLGPRVDELSVELAALVPAFSASDVVAVRLLSLALVRLERAELALSDAAPGDLARLRSDSLGWANAARRMLNDLGLTPLSRARLGLDLTRTAATREAALAALDAAGRRLRLASEGEPGGGEAS